MSRQSTAPTPTSYADAARILAAGRTYRTQTERKIANNTTLYRVSDRAIAVRLHWTDVVTFFADGRVELRTGGWNTSTTRARLNAYAPAGVTFYQRDGVLYVRTPDGVQEFGDSVTVVESGRVFAHY